MLKLKCISEKNNVSLDLICYLSSINITKDNIGNQIKTPVDRLVYCAEISIYSSEFYNAGQISIKPEHLLVIDIEEYGGETNLLYDEVRYNIYRTFPRKDGFIELYCNKKAGA